MTKVITVQAGQRFPSVNFSLPSAGVISGRVLHGNSEPVIGTGVFLVASQYVGATLQYVFIKSTVTDATGAYEFKDVAPGRPYFILARRVPQRSLAISDAPDEPTSRPRIPVPSYYPGTPQVRNAETVTLRPGERKQRLDIRVSYSLSYCLESSVEKTRSNVRTMYTVIENQPLGGLALHTDLAQQSGLVGGDGRIRVCDLSPGDYQLTIQSMSEALTGSASTGLQSPSAFSTSVVRVVDDDVVHFFAGNNRSVSVTGKVTWEEGSVPESAVPGQLQIRAVPLRRAPWIAELLPTRANIPGVFQFDKLYSDDYVVKVSGVPSGAYIKAMTYAGRNILGKVFRPGSGLGESSMRIVMATDGGSVAVKVVDEDRRPLSDTSIFLIPINVSSDAEMASVGVFGQTDQYGDWVSPKLRPGKYRVIATDALVEVSPQIIAKLWRALDTAEIVEITPQAFKQFHVSPTTADWP